MIFFEEVTRDHFSIIQSLYKSVPEYALMEERVLPLSDSILQEEFLNPDTVSLIGYFEEEPVLLVDYLPKHPQDGTPWIGLFLLDASQHGTGTSSRLLSAFCDQFLSQEPHIHLAVLPDNFKAQRFWEKHGFRYVRTSISNREQQVDVYVSDSNANK
ncbi:GNAT family N-acetyltransferase [Exiguobacterium sp. BMC-KP]|uniref:GNAT family N-acetyltransferase n=1 Tax=Exiguobacterium sp. BMC-KP TaxID=1684312 RepID=UPI0006AA4556|nr:GNAT family N-acetyltransferase [Exiguobacterium sp. BMC-KP]